PHHLSHHNHIHPSKTSTNPSLLLVQKYRNPHKRHFSIRCTSDLGPEPNNDPSFPTPNSDTLNSPETFPIERRRKSEITRERKPKTGLVKPEPPNFEVGWKRTKVINLEKPKGYVIMDFLDKLVALMDREFGSTELLAKAGEIVAERS